MRRGIDHCQRSDERYASVTRLKPDGTGLEILAHGVRNTVGFDWHPETKELWFTDNGRYMLGDDVPLDEFNHAPTPGLHFGFPYCHGKDIADPEFGAKRPCRNFVALVLDLGPHVAALGMRLYTGSMFPPAYRNQIFIAQHGSWNRSKKIGYRVMHVQMEGARVLEYTAFAEGWLQGENTWGRPVDVQVILTVLCSSDMTMPGRFIVSAISSKQAGLACSIALPDIGTQVRIACAMRTPLFRREGSRLSAQKLV